MRFLPLTLVLFLCSTACEEPVGFAASDEEPRLVVVGELVEGEKVKVFVSRSSSSLDTDTTDRYVRDAQVELYQESDFLEALQIRNLKGSAPYYSLTDFRPQAGVQYRISVDAPGFDPVMATSFIPPKISIEKMEVADLQMVCDSNGLKRYQVQVRLQFSDPGSTVNYYHLNFYRQIIPYSVEMGDTLALGPQRERVLFDPQLNSNEMTAHLEGGLLFQDDQFNGDVFDRIFQIDVTIRPEQELIGRLIAELRAVSEDYYLFYRSLSRQQYSNTNPFGEPVIIYNNIENGAGNFSGYSNALDSLGLIKGN